jgi:competence ComEA-like helix-hairpin-helix protein
MLDNRSTGFESAVGRRIPLLTVVMTACVLLVAVCFFSAPGFPSSKLKPAEPIVLNQATAEQLMQLPGIGPVLAKRIVEFRTKHGRFRRLEELLAIRGVSRKKFESWKPYLRLDEPAQKN